MYLYRINYLIIFLIPQKNIATEAERRFKSIREKYRRRKILLERDVSNNVEHSKLKRWDLYNKLTFLDDYMIPRKLVLSILLLFYYYLSRIKNEYSLTLGHVNPQKMGFENSFYTNTKLTS